MAIQNKLKWKYLLIIPVIIITINLIGSAIVNDSGLIIEFKPTKTIFMFAHGNCYEDKQWGSWTERHVTTLNGEYVDTKYILDELKAMGYEKAWLSQCYTGDCPLYANYSNGDLVDWYPWVSRNEEKGLTRTFFTGFGLKRFAVGVEDG